MSSIPKIFHRIWLGRRPMPPQMIRWGDSWTRFHPSWTMRLWTEDNLPPSRYPDAIKNSVNVSQQANIYRYEIMLQYGGIYVDTDFECLKNLEPLIQDLDFFTAYQITSPKYQVHREHMISNALFGCTPGHPILQELVDDIPKTDVTIGFALGPPFLTTHINNHPEATVFDKSLFYPYDWTELHRATETFPDSYAVHHWASQWYPWSRAPLINNMMLGEEK